MAPDGASNFRLFVQRDRTRVYTLCIFNRDEVVPTVELIDALNDQDAILIASSMRQSTTRELWERHRLITRIPSAF